MDTPPPDPTRRPELLTVAQVMQTLEHRIHNTNEGVGAIRASSETAVSAGVPIIMCRPEQVSAAARVLDGTLTRIGAAVDYHCPGSPLMTGRTLEQAAVRLVRQGATDLALVASAQRASAPHRRHLASDITALSEIAASFGGQTRVIINARHMTLAGLLNLATVGAACGAHLIECGAWNGGRVRFAHLVHVRAALGPSLSIKWAPPVRSLDMLLLGLAEGANRFNGNIPALLDQARTRHQQGGISIPRPGTDY